MRLRSLSTVLFCLTAVPAGAAPLTLLDVPAGLEVQQTGNRPCIFGDNSCDAGLLGTYTVFPTGGPPPETYQESQAYSIETLRGAVGNLFGIGIDVNTTSAKSEVLDYFRVVNVNTGVTLFTYEGDQNLAQAVDLRNGNGYSDWLLSTVDLTTVAAGNQIRFDVRVTGAVDGREQFFILPGGNQSQQLVPEPASLLLLGSGLTFVASRLRNRGKRNERA